MDDEPAHSASEMVLIRRSRSAEGRIFHTEPNCRRVTEDHKKKPRGLLADDYEECSFCDGSADHGKPEGPNVATRLREED